MLLCCRHHTDWTELKCMRSRAWFCSYCPSDISILHQGHSSPPSVVEFGVPQGPILFIMYTADVIRIVERHGLGVHQYADDTQVYASCRPDNSASLCHDLGECISSVASWMNANRFQLNAAKTELMWCVPSRRRHQLPADQPNVGPVVFASVDSVRDLGLYLNSDMHGHVLLFTRMDAHWCALVVSSCFGVLRRIRCIRHSLPREALAMLVTSFIASKVDYCNVTFTGLARCELDRIQSREFTLASCTRAHPVQVMRSCAPLPQRCSTTVSDRVGSAHGSRVVGCVQRPGLKFWCRPHVVQPSVTAPSPSPVLESLEQSTCRSAIHPDLFCF